MTKTTKQALLDLIAEESGRFEAQARYSGQGEMYFAGVADGLNKVWKHLAGTEPLPSPQLPFECDPDA